MSKKSTDKLTQKERLEVILDIVKKLKFYVATNGSIINLYNDEYTFVQEFKKISNEYIQQDDNNVKEYKGTLLFEEIDRNIDYIFPSKNYKKPLFVIRKRK